VDSQDAAVSALISADGPVSDEWNTDWLLALTVSHALAGGVLQSLVTTWLTLPLNSTTMQNGHRPICTSVRLGRHQVNSQCVLSILPNSQPTSSALIAVMVTNVDSGIGHGRLVLSTRGPWIGLLYHVSPVAHQHPDDVHTIGQGVLNVAAFRTPCIGTSPLDASLLGSSHS